VIRRLLAPVLALAVVSALIVGGTSAVPTADAAAAIQPDEDVTFASGGVTFYASYRAPVSGASKVPAAVIIGGTGAIDRNGDGAGLAMEQYRWLADLLSAQGIASIRYDKLGTGATGLGPYTSDPDAMLPLSYDQLRLQPARDALSFLADQPGIDAERLIVVGHSEGGADAISIVHEPGSAPAPAGLALVEPSYFHILDVISQQLSEQMDAAAAAGAMTAEDAGTLEAWMHDGVAEIRSGTAPYPDPGPVPLPGATDFTQVIQADIQTNIYGSDPVQMVVSHSYRTRYGKEFDAIDPADIAPSVAISTLVTCGTKDFNTPCGDGSRGSGVIALAEAFRPGVARFVEIPDMVHILRDVGGNDVPNIADQIGYPFSAVLEAEFSAFVATFNEVPQSSTTTTTTNAVPAAVTTPRFTG
jgi:pimeloyl-ACP methyl ester carboxylesterase